MISLNTINNALKASGALNTSETSDGSRVENNFDKCKTSILSFKRLQEAVVLRKKIDNLPTESDIYALAKQLSGADSLDYVEFKQLLLNSQLDKQHELSPASKDIREYLSAKTFLILPKDIEGRVRTEHLLKFVTKSMDVEEVGLNLMRHCMTDDGDSDTGGWGVHGVSGSSGFICEAELERYVFELIPQIRSCEDFDYNFYPFYAYAACRRFFFYLDVHRSHRLSVHKLAHSSIMEDFVRMRRPTASEDSDGRTIGTSRGSTLDSWFHGDHIQRIYNTYLNLDVDSNGTLSADELYNFSGVDAADGVRLTYAAIHRILEETVAYTPVEMDFKGFLDLVLALENKACVQSIRYFWNAINVDKTGRLSPGNIEYFYREIYSSLKEHGCDAPAPSNVVVEVYDILSCSDPQGPTFKDVVASGQGGVVMSMLLDVTGFWQYDNRESLIAQQQAQQ